MSSVNPQWPAWFARLVREYEFHYPPSDLMGDPVVCWHTIPPHGYIWRAGAMVILGSRTPLPEETLSPESETAGDETAEADMTAADETDSNAAASADAAADENLVAGRPVEVLYEYRLSDLLRERFRVEATGGLVAHFARRPAAYLVRDAHSSRLRFAPLGIDVELEED